MAEPSLADDFAADVAAVESIEAVPTILQVICRMTGMGLAAVARVTEEQWVACQVHDLMGYGLKPGSEIDVHNTFCRVVREQREPIVIDNAAADPFYADHPIVTRFGLQSYISVPIVLRDGRFFGTLCAMDPNPGRLSTPGSVDMFKLFAELIAFHLDARDRLASIEAVLHDERRTSELREQFIAVLGHDLRNPLAAIDSGVTLLQQTPLDARAAATVGRIQNSVERMARLIDDVLDFARGRLGGGLVIERDDSGPLQPMLEQVVTEFQASSPQRSIEAQFDLDRAIACDRCRICQLLSNLIDNALTHGLAAQPVRIRGAVEDNALVITVTNAAEPIPQTMLSRLFHPFQRGQLRASRKGLGLGLFIAAEIAKAHGGTLEADSSPDETRFTFRMPIQPAASA
ncbi:GAF domain-containing sensor histidine kinase [Mangrovicella endophytica]|uniref:GAF domain-containing sensor histidine kinase n=1 Tax=Mangrovicella endophytica TaxID=2066697 RepID=UPI000C9E2404|nr:GAF domain-containing sensor histidine kinase [Mangrovicella endophytica]